MAQEALRQVNYSAPKHVRNVIAALGRTEDVKFSPNNRRLAVAGFVKNKIAVFDIHIAVSQDGKSITLTDVAEISSTHFNCPHGLDFIDDETIIVANRKGSVCIFGLPPGETGSNFYEVAPLAVIRSDIPNAAGSVSLIRRNRNLCEALCNNPGHNIITKHVLHLSTKCSVKSNTILLKKWLDNPDGICVSREMQWIAISNHNAHSVLLYEYKLLLNKSSDPDGILRGAYYPHGLAFTSDGCFILVADAGSPYVHIYEKDVSEWRGVRSPIYSSRVLSDEDFFRGRHSHGGPKGGPRGIDIDNTMNIFVTTGEIQPLAFFDLARTLENVKESKLAEICSKAQRSLRINYELDLQLELSKERARAEVQIASQTNRRSRRIRASLRWLLSTLRNLV